jgi:hypothetical protein
VAQVAQFNNNKAFRLFLSGTNLAQVAQTNLENDSCANKVPTKCQQNATPNPYE